MDCVELLWHTESHNYVLQKWRRSCSTANTLEDSYKVTISDTLSIAVRSGPCLKSFTIQGNQANISCQRKHALQRIVP